MKTNILRRLPKNLYGYFWEIDRKSLDAKKYGAYIVKRLLEHGRPEAIRWAWKHIPRRVWRKALQSREISQRTRSFWESLVR
ncbi:MAG: hypothetical protein AAB897_00910 [Patescibacteria group bacterium]